MLVMDPDAQAYASEMLGEVDCGLLDMHWSFLSLRAAHVHLLRTIGTPWDVVKAQAGVNVDTPYRWRLPSMQQLAACEIADLLAFEEGDELPPHSGLMIEVSSPGDRP